MAFDDRQGSAGPVLHLLGRPQVGDDPGGYRIRSQKSWAVLAYLLLTGPTGRERLATLLFSSADDPLRALRWSLSEVRRALGPDAELTGDPVRITLPPGLEVDVEVVLSGHWSRAVRLPGLGSELLEGMAFADAAGFEAWLLVERRRMAAASAAALHAAALGTMAAGRFEEARGYAARVVMADPLDENHQALLIGAHRLAGDQDAAERQLAACTELFARELEVTPGPLVREAARPSAVPPERLDEAALEALVETGQATVAAGAVDAGVAMLREAVAAGQAGTRLLRVRARLALAEALIHAARGRDEEGLALLHAAVAEADPATEPGLTAELRVELGYVEFLRARYPRAEAWLLSALDLDAGDDTVSRAAAYLGAAYSDQGRYADARAWIGRAVAASRRAGQPRREAYAVTMLGRLCLLRGVPADAGVHLTHAIELAERDHWLSFVPWPQAMLGEAGLQLGSRETTRPVLDTSFARACRLGDPCWEAAAARALALLAEAEGDHVRAFELLAEARRRCRRLPDLYVWMDAAILDSACTLGLRHSHPETRAWVEALHDLASGAGMWDLAARAMLHRAALGDRGALEAAQLLVERVDSPALAALAQRTVRAVPG